MADFCKQCSTEIFGEGYCDLNNITSPADESKGLYACVLCEGCGPIQVKSDGTCISVDCMRQHGKDINLTLKSALDS